MTFSNIYCAEAAPAHLRAVLVALFSEWVTIGSIVGAAVTNATSRAIDKSSYQIPLGIQFIVPAILSVGLLFVPESPRYLVNKGRRDAGRKALAELRGASLRPDELELEFAEMVQGIEEERKLASSVGPLDMFRGTVLFPGNPLLGTNYSQLLALADTWNREQLAPYPPLLWGHRE